MRIGPMLKQEIAATFEVVPHRSNPDELCFLCPQPGCGDTTGNRSVNLKTGLTNCWRCNQGGDFLRWAAGLGYRFNVEHEHSSTAPRHELPTPASQGTVIPVVAEVALPKGFVKIADDPTSVYTRWITEMAQRKNLEYRDFALAGVGFTRIDPHWEAFAIFPVCEYGRTVYYQGRTYIDEPDKPTKKFPSRNEVQYGAKFWIYNIDEVRQRKPPIVLIVESILNVLSLRKKLHALGWQDAVVPVCVFKHSVSREQWMKLAVLRGVKEFCLLFDHDATAKAWTSRHPLRPGQVLTIAEMPGGEGQEKLDANDDVEAALEAFEQRKAYTPANGLIFQPPGEAVNAFARSKEA